MIHIKDDWYIDIDEYTFNLQQYAGTYVDREGKERKNWKNVTYHSTLANAIFQYERMMVRKELKPDMELVDALQKMEEKFLELEKNLREITHGV